MTAEAPAVEMFQAVARRARKEDIPAIMAAARTTEWTGGAPASMGDFFEDLSATISGVRQGTIVVAIVNNEIVATVGNYPDRLWKLCHGQHQNALPQLIEFAKETPPQGLKT